jgi:histidinol-phosphate/aromatic aminotransferase/cobyric acid decarboxylase-like protein
MIRSGESFGIPDCSRVTIGRHEDNARFIEVLEHVLSKL